MVAPTKKFSFLSPPQQPGEIGRLGSYSILGLIGEGGMGHVFLAKDLRLQREVALKVMSRRIAASPQARARFIREARAQAAVHHDNVATIFEVGQENETPFLAMELLKGHALDRVLRSKTKFDNEQILAIGQQIARGLAAAHARGIIHRDIKPANIWIVQGSGRPKILDFGLAALTGPDSLSGKGAVVGTPGYLAPEQARDEPVDDRSDIYSLGIVLYQMCSGTIPFRSNNVLKILIAIATQTAQPLGEIVPDIPESVSDLIQRMLSPEPCDRPANAMALAEELEYVNEGLAFGPLGSSDSISFSFEDLPPQAEFEVTQPLKSVPIEAPKPTREKSSLRVIIGVGAVLMIVAAIVGYVFRLQPTGKAPSVATGSNQPAVKSTPKPPVKATPKPPAKVTPKPPAEVIPKPPAKVTPKPPAKVTPKPPAKVTPKPPAKVTPKPPSKPKPQPQVQPKPKPPANPPVKSGPFQWISMTKTKGADVSIGYGDSDPKGGSPNLVVHKRNPAPGRLQGVYLRFDISGLNQPTGRVSDAVVLLSCRKLPEPVYELQLYGVPHSVLGDWTDRKRNALTAINAINSQELWGFKLLAKTQLTNGGRAFTLSANNVRFSDPRIGAFCRAEGAKKSVTFAVIPVTTSKRPALFMSREAGNQFAPRIGLR